jgi:branched-subunit amino acid transport protein
MIILMGIVTFIPRLIPMLWLRNLKLSSFWMEFFDVLPYAMLTTLVFPSVLSASGDYFLSGVGLLAAVALSYFNMNSMIVVIGSVVAVLMATYI